MRTTKWIALGCALVLLIAANALAESPVVDMEAIMSANSLQSLLNRHSSVALLQRMRSGESAVWANRLYRYSAHRQDGTVREGDAEYLHTADHCLLLSYLSFEDGIYPVPFILLDSGLDDGIRYDVEKGIGTELLYDPEITAKEKVQRTERNDDGTLDVTTWLTGEDFEEGWGYGYQAGSYCELVYTLDAETLELQSDVETVLDAQGRPLSESLYYQLFDKSNLQSSQRVLYDVPVPEEAEQMMTILDGYLNASGDDARTVTYILDAGTPRERVLTSTGAKGYAVMPAAGEYECGLYLDAALTEPAPPDDLKSDRRLYVKLIQPEGKGNEA